MFLGQDSDEARAYAQVTGDPHEAKLSHELIAAAASYEGRIFIHPLNSSLTSIQAAKAYEHHRASEGRPINHEKAVELLAGFTGGFVDRMAETRGLDAFDRERLKRDAHSQAATALEQSGQY